MRLIQPTELCVTSVSHLNAQKKPDGFYLMVVSANGGSCRMMSSVVRVTNKQDEGVEITASENPDTVLNVRVLVDQGGGRATTMIPIQGINSNLSSVPTSLTCCRGTAAFLQQTVPGIFCLTPADGYSIEMGALGNIACAYCGRRINVGAAKRADRLCHCGAEFPELKIPFEMPPSPPAAFSVV